MFLCIKPDNVRLQGATNGSTVTILYIAKNCWRAGPYPTRYWCARSLITLAIWFSMQTLWNSPAGDRWNRSFWRGPFQPWLPGFCNLITLTIKPYVCWPIKLRAHCTHLWIREVVNDMIKAGVIQISTSPWAAPVTFDPPKNKSYLDLLHSASITVSLMRHGKRLLPPAICFRLWISKVATGRFQ